MTSAIQRADTFKDLLEAGEDGPYVFHRMFSAEGRAARSRSKRTFKLLRKIDRPLRRMLREHERVFFVTRGVAQLSLLEWYFLGAPLYYMNQRAIVFTSHRILLLQIDSRGNPRETRNEIAYAAVKRLGNSWTGTTRIDFNSGGRVLLTGVPKADRKWMAETLDRLLSHLEAPPAQSELEDLCPHCYSVVARRPPACPACGGPFKSPRTAALLSLVYPGAGDLYLGHRGFAYLQLAAATLLWIAVIALAVAPDASFMEAVITLGFLVAFVHGGDAVTTRMIAKKGIVPDEGRPHRWRFAAAAAIPLVGLGSVAAMAPSKGRLRPDPAVVTGNRLPEAHLLALQDAGYVEPGEIVHFFYSIGPATILQDGSLLLEDRIVAYESTFDGQFHQSAHFADVVDFYFDPFGADDPIRRVYVVTETEGTFLLFLGTDGGGDEAFIEAMTDRWRSVRSEAPGVWFDGGAGASAEDAVLVRGLENPDELADAAAWALSLWHGEEKLDWVQRGRTEHADGTLEVEVELPEEGMDTVFFAAAP